MSYDIEIGVFAEGCHKFARIAEPQYANPTYNLRKMFQEAMTWDFSQSEQDENGHYQTCYYNCADVLPLIERGIRELRTRPGKYKKYEPDNGWGTLGSAIEDLESLRDCIYDQAEYIPIEHMWMKW